MPASGVARRYATAVFQIAQEENDVDGWLRDLRAIRDALQEPALQAYLDSPSVSTEEKIQAMQNSLRSLESKRRNFVYLLIQNKRTNAIGDIVAAYEDAVNRARGIVNARVTTAVPLNEREQTLVRRRLEELTTRHVNVTTDVDPAVIGGFVARMGDQLIDASVAGRLSALRDSLMS
jgi:F-type H+-transporting ATPase subunit delta